MTMRNKILIVDDSTGWLSFHRELIYQLYGNLFEITVASSALEAYNLARKNLNSPFPVIITDLQMEAAYGQKLAGEWFIENIQTLKEYSSTRIIIISGMYNIEEIAKKLNVDCISKRMLVQNKLLLKYMFEKLMPFLTQI